MKPAISVCLVLLAGRVAGAQDLQPWASNTHPTDAPKRHVEEVTRGTHVYVVTQGGTMDGLSSRGPVGVYEAWKQVWESNRSVRMENLGTSDVVNPWISNGRNRFRNVQEVIASALKPGMSDREKALSLYDQEVRYRYHWVADNKEVGEPVKIFNVYGYNTCGNDSISLAGLWTRAGLKVSPARVVGHCVTQVFYDGRWHMLDGDQQGAYLLRDGYTIAGEQDIVRDHDLIKRTHTKGLLRHANRRGDEWEASLYWFEGEEKFTRNSAARHTMNMTLRPGEALVWRWGHLSPPKVHGRQGVKFAHTVGNGLWEYRPDLMSDVWRKGAVVKGVRTVADGVAAEAGATGTIEWTMRSPYVIVGGRVEVEGKGAAFAISRDGKSWKPVEQDLDAHFPQAGPACYEYRLRCTLSGRAVLKKLAIVNDLQMAPLAMPDMIVGRNRFEYTDESGESRNVKITHRWVERSATRRPAPPARAISPSPGRKSDGTKIVFKWSPAKDPDGDRIDDYHFQLSDRPDVHYPLSSNFTRIISKTPDRGKAQFSLPRPGLLAPGRTYYWRVRAKDSKGVWSPWSTAWKFTAGGPAVPLEVRLDFDAGKGRGVLRWKPNGEGDRAVAYRIYGSDEKGFTISDEPYEVFLGNQKTNLPKTFKANFAAETKQTELEVVGTGIELANANRAYYRVVAIDAEGRRSAASTYAGAPRPFIYAPGTIRAKVGQPIREVVASIRSLGHLTARGGGKLDMSYWDIERPKYAIVEGPAWLKVDPSTGTLSGTPDKAGRIRVVLSASIDLELRKIDERALIWGHDKTLGTSMERVGETTRHFSVEVRE